jgi:exodeoxyribonuclease VII large subunit
VLYSTLSGTLSITELNTCIQQSLENLSCVCVQAEIASITKASSGHWYLNLKDTSCQIKAVMFKQKNMYATFVPEQGQTIQCFASVELYSARGELQLLIDSIRPVGEGALHKAFLALQHKLHKLGMFDVEHKKKLADIIQTVAIITSLDAAALQDIIKNMYLKVPHIHILIYPCLVQGMQAEASIIQQIEQANIDNQLHKCKIDALIVTRGGGSLEDLSAYNQEQLALAIFNSDIPVISAVGHETDTTIADMVASYRVSTPTACIDLLGKTKLDYLSELHNYAHNIKQYAYTYIYTQQAYLNKIDNAIKLNTQICMQNMHNNLYMQHMRIAQLHPKLANKNNAYHFCITKKITAENKLNTTNTTIENIDAINTQDTYYISHDANLKQKLQVQFSQLVYVDIHQE